MKIRKATKSDIPFIVNAMIEIESFDNTNTFNRLFDTQTPQTEKYLEAFLQDEENMGNEFSLNTYIIVESEGENAGCCCLFFTDSDYYQSKSELFPIHLEKDHLNYFFEKVKSLPDNKNILTQKNYLEYLFVAKNFRNKGISKTILEHYLSQVDRLYLVPLANNTFAIDYYKRFGFVLDEENQSFPIDTGENLIYPGSQKVMLYKDNLKEN